jgi:hypothetical protein
VIGAGLLLVFVAIGVWIARDARRGLAERHRGDPLPAGGRPRTRAPQAKQRARAKGRAQRRARRRNR